MSLAKPINFLKIQYKFIFRHKSTLKLGNFFSFKKPLNRAIENPNRALLQPGVNISGVLKGIK